MSYFLWREETFFQTPELQVLHQVSTAHPGAVVFVASTQIHDATISKHKTNVRPKEFVLGAGKSTQEVTASLATNLVEGSPNQSRSCADARWWIRAHNRDTVKECRGTVLKDIQTALLGELCQVYEQGAHRRMEPFFGNDRITNAPFSPSPSPLSRGRQTLGVLSVVRKTQGVSVNSIEVGIGPHVDDETREVKFEEGRQTCQ